MNWVRLNRFITIAVSLITVVTLILYLVGAFVAADFSIRNWDALGRGMLAAFWVIAVCFVTGISAILAKELEKS